MYIYLDMCIHCLCEDIDLYTVKYRKDKQMISDVYAHICVSMYYISSCIYAQSFIIHIHKYAGESNCSLRRKSGILECFSQY